HTHPRHVHSFPTRRSSDLTAEKNDDEAFLEMVQRETFKYFWEEANASNGLVRDRSTDASPASIAAVGFGLSALTVGIDRGWITRDRKSTRLNSSHVKISYA